MSESWTMATTDIPIAPQVSSNRSFSAPYTPGRHYGIGDDGSSALVYDPLLIDGNPIPSVNTARWGYTVGVNPQIERFVVHKSIMSSLAKKETVTIYMSGKIFRHLYIVENGPYDHPDLWTITIADKRFWWGYAWIGQYWFNWRRRSGNRRWIGGAIKDFENTQLLADDYVYAPFSLNGGKKWQASEALLTVLATLSEKMRSQIGADAGFYVDYMPTIVNMAPLENVYLNNRGNAAVSSLLAKLQATGLYLNEDGNLRWVDHLDSKERDALSQVNANVWPACIGTEDRSSQLPTTFRVYFKRELDYRLEYVEEADPQPVDRSDLSQVDRLDCVLLVTDPTLEIPASTYWTARTVNFGQPITMHEAIAAFREKQHIIISEKTVGKISFQNIRRYWAMGQLSMIYGLGIGPLTADPYWDRRISAIYRGYRQSFRIPKCIMDNIEHWDIHLVGIIDEETHHRGISPVWSDYSRRHPSNRPIRYYDIEQKGDIENVSCTLRAAGSDEHLPVGNWSESVPLTRGNPISLSISTDMDLGIFTLDYSVRNTWGEAVETFPCALTEDSEKQQSRNVGEKITTFGLPVAELSAAHNMSILLKFRPSAPQGNRTLHSVDVAISDAAEGLGCTTPVSNKNMILEIYVDPDVATARFGWVDDGAYKASARKALGVADELNALAGFVASIESISSIMDPYLLDRDQIEDVAKAYASQALEAFLNRPAGRVVLGGVADLIPMGRMTEVKYEVTPSTSTYTTAKFQSALNPISELGYMKTTTLQRLGHVINPSMDR